MDTSLDAFDILDKTADSHADASPAQQATDADRAANGQQASKLTPERTAKPRLRSRMGKLAADKAAARPASHTGGRRIRNDSPGRSKRTAASGQF